MNTDALQRAYEALIAAANAVGTSSHLSASDDAEVSWRLCHIALSDQILTSAAHATFKGLPAVVNNLTAMDKALIMSLINRTTHSERVETMRHNGAEFVERIAQLSESQGAAAVRLIVHDRSGALVSDEIMSWHELVKLRADRHLPAHTKKLATLAG